MTLCQTREGVEKLTTRTMRRGIRGAVRRVSWWCRAVGSSEEIFCELNSILLMCEMAPLMPLTVHYIAVHHCSIKKKEKGSPPPLGCPVWIAIVCEQLISPVHPTHVLIVLHYSLRLLNNHLSIRSMSRSPLYWHWRVVVDCGEY